MDRPDNPRALTAQIEKLRILAAEWRDQASRTNDSYYIDLMVRTAQELDERARELEAALPARRSGERR